MSDVAYIVDCVNKQNYFSMKKTMFQIIQCIFQS